MLGLSQSPRNKGKHAAVPVQVRKGARYLLVDYTVLQDGLHRPDSLVHSVGNRNPEVHSVSGLAELLSRTCILPSSFIVLPLLE